MASQDERATGMDLQKLIRLITLGLAVAAVVKERMWDPEGAHLISPRVFGVGWTLNVGRLVELVRQRVSAAG